MYDPLTQQELIILRGLARTNSWAPKADILRRYKRDAGVKGGRTAGLIRLVDTALPHLIAKAYAKKEVRGAVEGYVITPRGRAVLDTL